MRVLLIWMFCATLISCGRNTLEMHRDHNQSSDKNHEDAVTSGEFSYPELALSTIDELDTWVESNGGVNLTYFKSGSLVPQFVLSEILIEHLVVIINGSDGESYNLVGHTNSQGSNTANMTLSIQRSSSTLEVLVDKFNLDSSKISAIGEGESNPLNENITKEDRRLNSRVELRKIK